MLTIILRYAFCEMLFPHYANPQGQQTKVKKEKLLQISVSLIIKKVGDFKLEKQLQLFVQKQTTFIFLATFGIFVSKTFLNYIFQFYADYNILLICYFLINIFYKEN